VAPFAAPVVTPVATPVAAPVAASVAAPVAASSPISERPLYDLIRMKRRLEELREMDSILQIEIEPLKRKCKENQTKLLRVTGITL
jgi:hypothetical protein